MLVLSMSIQTCVNSVIKSDIAYLFILVIINIGTVIYIPSNADSFSM